MNPDYLNNLPKSDSNDELEEISFDALKVFLPKNKFQLRDERNKDKGVDASLEAKTNGVSTNFRALIQLKGTRKKEIKKDGSVTYSVKTSNLNYLLNYPASLYILYIEPRNEFRFVWAKDELKRLTEENPNWSRQDKISLNFKEVLNSDKLNQIHEEIIRNGTLSRDVNNSLLFSSNSNLVLEIDSSSLQVNDSNTIKELLLKDGLSYLFYGHAETVLEKIGLLNSKDKELPQIQILAAQAEYDLGHYPVAKNILVRLRLHTKNLSETDSLLASYFELSCDFQTGRIDIHKYTESLKELSQKPGVQKLPFKLRLSYLNEAILLETNITERRRLLEELRNEIEKDISNDSISEADLHNQSILLEAEGKQISLEFSYETNQLVLKRGLGFNSNIIEFYNAHCEKLLSWDKKLIAVKDKTNKETLAANIWVFRAFVLTHWISTQMLISKYFGIAFDNNGLFKEIKANLQFAIDVYSTRKLTHLELGAKNILVDVLNFENNHTEATETSSNISKLADDFDYANVKYIAENPFAKGIKEILEKDATDSDESYLKLNDDTIHLYAKQRIEALKIPSNRLSNIEKSLFAARDIARERLNWCQFIELIEDLVHRLNLLTFFSINPNRKVHCRIHQHISMSPNPDWNILLTDFKNTYCENCPDREPKSQ